MQCVFDLFWYKISEIMGRLAPQKPKFHITRKGADFPANNH